MSDMFSKRYGFEASVNEDELVTDEAPISLRKWLVVLARECGIAPIPLRRLICRAVGEYDFPVGTYDQFNDQKVANDCIGLLLSCEWHRVFDAIERIASYLSEVDYSPDVHAYFHSELNDYFIHNKLGWKLIDCAIEIRGSHGFVETVRSASDSLLSAGLAVASREMRASLSDLSKRPEPDLTGAIRHAMASLECIARHQTDNPSATLGSIIKSHPQLLPKPLDQVIEKAWGYSSEYARHVREGQNPSFEDAQLVVSLCAAVSSYLITRLK